MIFPKTLFSIFFILHIALAFQIALISDRDEISSGANERKSCLKFGLFERTCTGDDSNMTRYHVKWQNQTEILGRLLENGRGMELSELVLFHDQLLAFDDRTGVIFELAENLAIPRMILADGNGKSTAKGFKAEWATVKGPNMIVGSIGKEWTTQSGEFVNSNPLFVKKINQNHLVEHLDWSLQYKKLMKALDIQDPGYLIHEAVCWNDSLQKWFFFPRRLSHRKYDAVDELIRGTNIYLTVSENFETIQVGRMGTLESRRGVSSCKFVPDSPHHVLVLRTEETETTVSTYIFVFDVIEQKILMEEEWIANEK